jgi:hypothetical protein
MNNSIPTADFVVKWSADVVEPSSASANAREIFGRAQVLNDFMPPIPVLNM